MLGKSGHNQNLKDISRDQSLALKDNTFPISYPKTTKLISALYMVTDIMDKEEPMRHKLRTLGGEVISDIYSNLSKTNKTISEILSFLEVAASVAMISEMNAAILKKEFLELQESIQKSGHNSNIFDGQTLSEFLKEE